MQESIFILGIFYGSLVKNHVDRRAVFVQARRYHKDVFDAGAIPQQLTYLSMQIFNFTDFGRSSGHIERFIGQIVFSHSTHFFAMGNGILNLVQERILQHFDILTGLINISLKIEIVIRRYTPKLDVVTARAAPTSKQVIFLVQRISIFGDIINIRFKLSCGQLGRITHLHAFLNFTDISCFRFPIAFRYIPSAANRVFFKLCIFPEFHTRVLDVRIHFVLLGIFLQDDAVELAHARKTKNKDRESFAVILR